MTIGQDQWALVGALSEPQRRAVYEAVCHEAQPVTREQVASQAAISRSLAAFHLDKLVDAGLLEVDHRPPPDRRRPKIGRPAKRYRRSGKQVELTLPTRRYDLAGRVLAAALAASQAGEPPREAARRIAHAEGLALAGAAEMQQAATGGLDALSGAGGALRALGYAPTRDADRLLLRNCPFSAVAAAATDVTCDMNLSLLEGLLRGLELDSQVTAILQPQPGGCCVTLSPVRAG